MANPQLFQSTPGRIIRKTDAANDEKAPAYQFSPEHALAQYASTGCLNSTFYASAEDQTKMVLELCKKVIPEFIAKTAIYCREVGLMKDMPVLLLAELSAQKQNDILRIAFPKVVKSLKDLRNFVQIVRSGATGRKSFGTASKRLCQAWLNGRTPENLFKQSVGQNPSLADLIKMLHPKPGNVSRETFYAYIIGKPKAMFHMPRNVLSFESIKESKSLGDYDLDGIPFMMLTQLDLSTKDWTRLAGIMTWNQLRQNLNSLNKHKVFEDKKVLSLITQKIANADLVAHAKVFPYQIFTSYLFTKDLDPDLRGALQDALDHSLMNLPSFGEKRLALAVDISGSMSTPVTGHRKGATTQVQCSQVASLFAASFLKKNKETICFAFSDDLATCDQVNRRDSVVTIAESFPEAAGGTDCSLPLQYLIKQKKEVDLLIYLSDNQSWMDTRPRGRNYAWEPEQGTNQLQLWNRYQQEVNPKAKLVCIDLQPNNTTQAHEREDILNVGGFSDSVFDVIELFSKGELSAHHWVGEIGKVTL